MPVFYVFILLFYRYLCILQNIIQKYYIPAANLEIIFQLGKLFMQKLKCVLHIIRNHNVFANRNNSVMKSAVLDLLRYAFAPCPLSVRSLSVRSPLRNGGTTVLLWFHSGVATEAVGCQPFATHDLSFKSRCKGTTFPAS